MEKFSALLPFCETDNDDDFIISLESIKNQTLKPTEILITVDGNISNKKELLLRSLSKNIEFKLIRLEKKGLWNALNQGIKSSNYDLVIRCDADDFNEVDRFQKQVEFMGKHRDVSISSSNIIEFDKDFRSPLRKKKVPQKNLNIYSFFRNPINHNAVILRKSLFFPEYQYTPGRQEDYRLWKKLIISGRKLMNIKDYLVRAKTVNLPKKRIGKDYAFSEVSILKLNIKHSLILSPISILLFIIRFFLRFLSPKIMSKVYIFLRQKN